eukprot:CAMPEP_0197432810 /NCGR_PEP_ID=MMETSP1175-20131217/805_1 /TAXON_ID=1003142 /ORGANISM="Triceratium dubium, Strain CCMP147" /LENGTH=32 /DNA_ID= /DNA_START= /DNA_END= /DNA_ORIENTATION=
MKVLATALSLISLAPSVSAAAAFVPHASRAVR